jgi:hypothetical protein
MNTEEKDFLALPFSEEGVLAYLQRRSIENPKDLRSQNMFTIFKELGKYAKGVRKSFSEIKEGFPVMDYTMIHLACEHGLSCHGTVPHLALSHRKDDNLQVYFGFVKIAHPQSLYFCCHSFLETKEGDTIYDPHCEWLFDRNNNYELSMVSDYFGINFPLDLFQKINEWEGANVYPNIGGFIKERIIPSEERTNQFINYIRNKTPIPESWRIA